MSNVNLSLAAATPPKGTTKTVLLTRAERKAIGRFRLAHAVVRRLDGGSKLTLRRGGCRFFFKLTVYGWSVVHDPFAGLERKLLVGATDEELSNYLAASWTPCDVLRLLKLSEKAKRDQHSIAMQRLRQIQQDFIAHSFNFSDL